MVNVAMLQGFDVSNSTLISYRFPSRESPAFNLRRFCFPDRVRRDWRTNIPGKTMFYVDAHVFVRPCMTVYVTMYVTAYVMYVHECVTAYCT